MLPQSQISSAPALDPAADLRPLLEQIGSPDALAVVAQALTSGPVNTAAELRNFLRDYHARILRPLELPAIYRAFGHVSRHEVRELVAFDRQLSHEPLLQSFAAASRRAGRDQLERLRPLRDERVAQRYLSAVEEGKAEGWHTLVYGMTLAIYSRPLRQWLLGYAQETTRGFINAASRSLAVTKDQTQAMFDELCEGLPGAIEPLLGNGVILRG